MIIESEYFDSYPASLPLISVGRRGLICGTGCGYQTVSDQADQLMLAHMKVVHPHQVWIDHKGVMHDG